MNQMKSDSVVEDDAVDFYLDETLDVDSQQYLMDRISTDPQLEAIVDNIIIRAIESQNSDGAISGQGDGTSDSIPARLSDGEFVFTAKAVESIGVENLEKMMARAEETADLGDVSDIELSTEMGVEGSDQKFNVKEGADQTLQRIESRIQKLEGGHV